MDACNRSNPGIHGIRGFKRVRGSKAQNRINPKILVMTIWLAKGTPQCDQSMGGLWCVKHVTPPSIRVVCRTAGARIDTSAAPAPQLGAKALILTHISGRYAAGTRPDQSEAADGANQSAAPYSDDEQLLADEATAAGYQGNVLVARDLWSYSVPRPSP
jgi:hypothetical protein